MTREEVKAIIFDVVESRGYKIRELRKDEFIENKKWGTPGKLFIHRSKKKKSNETN